MKTTLLYAAVVLGFGTTADAHPHIFVDAGADFTFDADGRLGSLRISWRYDAYTTLFMFDSLNLDTDGDGMLDDDDRAAIVEGETDWPPGYDGDVHLEMDGRPRAMGRPRNAVADMVEDRIVVTFDLPLTEPADLSGKRATLRLYDPGFYYAYSIAEVPRIASPPSGCTATLTPFEADAATAQAQAELAALSREEIPEQADIGRLFADVMVLTCD